jgi:hypothetical protein
MKRESEKKKSFYLTYNYIILVQENILNEARYQGSDTGIIFVNDK